MSGSYDYWREALANPQLIGTESLRIHENEPQCGYYRRRNKNGVDRPVAIYMEGENLVALEGDQVIEPDVVWTFVAKNPVAYEAYCQACETGNWPNEAAPIGHNREKTGDVFEDLKAEIEDEVEQGKALLSQPVQTQDQADRVGTWATKLVSLAKSADTHRLAEVRPHLDAQKAVNQKWAGIIDDAKKLGADLKKHVGDYLQKLAREEAERQRKAAEEARRLQAEADAAAAKVNDSEEAAREVEEKKAAAQRAADEAEAKKVSAGRTGSKVSLRTVTVAKIVDYDKALIALKDHPDMRELVAQLANRAARAGHPLDGVEFVQEQRAQ